MKNEFLREGVNSAPGNSLCNSWESFPAGIFHLCLLWMQILIFDPIPSFPGWQGPAGGAEFSAKNAEMMG